MIFQIINNNCWTIWFHRLLRILKCSDLQHCVIQASQSYLQCGYICFMAMTMSWSLLQWSSAWHNIPHFFTISVELGTDEFNVCKVSANLGTTSVQKPTCGFLLKYCHEYSQSLFDDSSVLNGSGCWCITDIFGSPTSQTTWKNS